MRTGSTVALVTAVLVALSVSCAEVEITRVREGEDPEGVRFYMPRPYVAVNEAFVVGGEAYVVGGEITPDGRYVLINDIDRSKLGSGHFVSRFLATAGKQIPATRVIASAEAAGPKSGGEQAGDEGAPRGGDEGGPAVTAKEKSGILNLKVSNDNSAYAITPLKRYFDILWLPDFEEQYVVHGEAGLGNASIAMQLGQGWSLQGLEATVDNSAIAGRIFKLIDQGTEILSTLGRAQLGLPPVRMGGEQSGAEEPPNATRFSGGTPLTIKVTFVRIAAPGIYPILKPKEMRDLARTDAEVKDRILVPVAPFTNIAFNTYEAVVIEAALATGDSPLRLHQYLDLRSTGAVPTGVRPKERAPEFWPDVSSRVSQQSGKKVTVNPKADGQELQVTIRNADGTTVPISERTDAARIVSEKVDAILKTEAPDANLPADVHFP